MAESDKEPLSTLNPLTTISSEALERKSGLSDCEEADIAKNGARAPHCSGETNGNAGDVSLQELLQHILFKGAPDPVPAGSSVEEAHVTCWDRVSPRSRAAMPLALAAARDSVIASAAVKYDSSDHFHIAMMKQIFDVLTGRSFADGDSWETIGFQRAESFETDLRGSGLLGPLCTRYMLEHFQSLAHHLFSLAGGKRGTSSAEPLEWPFMAVSLNISLHALSALKAVVLDRAIISEDRRGREQPAATVFFHFYCALFYEFGRSWSRLRRKLDDRQVAESIGALLRQMSTKKLSASAAEKLLAKFRKAMGRPPYAETQEVAPAGDGYDGKKD